MDAEGVERKLAAILAADVVGYSRLMADDEAATIRTLRAYRQEIAGLVGEHRGRVVDAPGDNVLAEFPTARDAVECAVEVQRVVQARNASLPEDRRMQFRIGVHLGDVAAEGGRIYGDGVNIAARLEGMAEPGGICLSDTVHQQVRDKVPVGYVDLGEHEVKNLPHPVRVYRVEIPAEEAVPVAAIAPWSRRRFAVAAGVLLVAVAAVIWWGMTPGIAPTSLPTALVVLPFADMSPDGDQEYFADGMAEELINTLSKIEGLRVVARTSAFAFKGKDMGIREIGEQLNVGAVVEGSVRKADDRLRITAQLVTVEDGFHLWSETYDRRLEDVFAIQDEIANAVAQALQVRLVGTSSAKPPTDDLHAYELYLMGRRFWSTRTEEGLRRAIEYFEQVLERNPDSALALAGLADAHASLWGFGFDRSDEVPPKAMAAASQALAIDDTLAEAHASLGFLLEDRLDWSGAEKELRRSLELNPGYATAHHWYGILLGRLGRVEEGLAELRRAHELDPLSPAINASLGILLSISDCEGAIEPLRRALEMAPENTIARYWLAYAYDGMGAEEEALETTLDAPLPPEVESALRDAWQVGGMQGLFQSLLELEIARTQERCTDREWVAAAIFAFTEDKERALECLEEGYERGQFAGGVYLKVHPIWDGLRSDPRFVAILKKMGLED
jgi:TolB-like protein/class 3 adenylate cyclase/Flp pilus assembly protein TadD